MNNIDEILKEKYNASLLKDRLSFEEWVAYSGYFIDEDIDKEEKKTRIERLDVLLNANPYHGEDGRFTEAPISFSKFVDYTRTQFNPEFATPDNQPRFFEEENPDVLFDKNVKTKEQEEAIKTYSQFGYSAVNEYLRTGKCKESDKEKIENDVKLIDSCMNGKLSQDMFVFRGFQGFSEKFKKPKEGDVIKDNAYLSTSYTNIDSDYFKHKIMLKVKKGTNALFIGENTGNTYSEEELLFPRNSEIKIEKDYSKLTYEEKDKLGIEYNVDYLGTLTIKKKSRLNRLDSLLNANPYHAEDGKFTFAPGGHGISIDRVREIVLKNPGFMDGGIIFREVVKELGYDKKPKVVSEKNYDDLKKSGDYSEIYRGFSVHDAYSTQTGDAATYDAVSYAREFIDGDYYEGSYDSRFGYGMYFTDDREFASRFSATLDENPLTFKDSVITCLIKKNSKLLEIDSSGRIRDSKIRQEYDNFVKENSDELAKEAEKMKSEIKGPWTDDDYERFDNLKDASYSFKDFETGTFAMIKGYDGLSWDPQKDEGRTYYRAKEYVLFNRENIIVKDDANLKEIKKRTNRISRLNEIQGKISK